ncbi:Zn(2)-C6 fungal-type domain-containing protein [Mycena kentingensis (nom. inval.)]|nr:Zn(2)-C6 fungal-type domain-containing protein [Mycena kentingensis (nom. inval.)]
MLLWYILAGAVLLGHAQPQEPLQQPSSPPVVDESLYLYAEGQLREGNIAGASLGIVWADGRTEYATWGKRTEAGDPVTTDTIFNLGSCSKAFLSASLGILMQDFKDGRNVTELPDTIKQFDWSTKVHDLLPGQWEVEDEWTTKKADLRDLLAHLTGLPAHDGSYPPGASTTEILANMKYLRASDELRQRYQYNNQMYMTGAYVVSKYAGMSYRDFVAERIFKPLKMSSSTLYPDEAFNTGRMTESWSRTTKRRIPFFMPEESAEFLAGAGGIQSTAEDMLIWARVMLNEGVDPLTKEIIIPHETFKLATSAISLVTGTGGPVSSFVSYGMGWARQSRLGHELVWHTGGAPGVATIVHLYPSDGFAVVVLANTASDYRPSNIGWAVADKIFGRARLEQHVESDPEAPAPTRHRHPHFPPKNPVSLFAGTLAKPLYVADFQTIDSAKGNFPPAFLDLYTHFPRFWGSHMRFSPLDKSDDYEHAVTLTTLFPEGFGADTSPFEDATERFRAKFAVGEDGEVVGMGFFWDHCWELVEVEERREYTRDGGRMVRQAMSIQLCCLSFICRASGRHRSFIGSGVYQGQFKATRRRSGLITMSSNEDDAFDSGDRTKGKIKRVARACDMCRRKKRRCDAAEPCDHCQKHNFVCTYIDAPSAQPLSGAEPATDAHAQAYISLLEARLKTTEKLLAATKSNKDVQQKSPGVMLLTNAIQRLNSQYPEPHSDDLTFTQIEDSFRRLAVDEAGIGPGFQGKSSGAALVKAAMDLKACASGLSGAIPLPRSGLEVSSNASRVPYTFPPSDLFASLVALYFSNVNPFVPVLHRPTFLAAVGQGTHLTNRGFAKTVLLVCAVAARYSDDPRVLSQGSSANPEEANANLDTAGWKWFAQVETDLSGHLFKTIPPTIFDLQAYCLAAEFLDCTSAPRTCWTLVGFGMRLSQDMGGHRFKVDTTHTNAKRTLSFEQEMEKRASWVLFLFEAQISMALGRCIALQSHDFDIQMPIMCDDEYWGRPEDPTTPLFRQPPEVPSRLDYFVCMLQVNRILSFCGKILYSSNRSKALIGLGDDKWEEEVVVELDSALNRWFETIPDHLRWDADNQIVDDVFFDQSAVLYCTYFHTRIVIHRPFIPVMRRSTYPTHLPSLAICNTAARSCSHVAQVHQKRRPNNPLWFSQTPLFTAAIVLLLNIWGGGANLGSSRAQADYEDVKRCMAVLEVQQRVWPSAGALLNTLKQLVAVDHPLAPSGGTPNSATYSSSSGFSPQEPVPAAAIHVDWSEPPYDPQLETAPPDLFSRDWADNEQGMEVDAKIDLWQRAPAGFDLMDWDSYLGNGREINGARGF